MSDLEQKAFTLREALIERFQTVMKKQSGQMVSKSEAQELARVLGFTMCVVGDHNINEILDSMNKMIDEVLAESKS